MLTSFRNDLTSSEQSDYLDAELCLTQYPATMDLGGSKTYWDEIQYNHITQADWVHFVVSNTKSKLK